MSGWGVLIIILALLPLALLSVPLTFRAGGHLGPEERRLAGGLSWGLGLVTATVELNDWETCLYRVRLAGLTLPFPRRSLEAKKRVMKTGENEETLTTEKAGKTRKKPARQESKSGFSLLLITRILNRQFLAAILVYMKKLFEALRLKLRLSGVYGTGDPALTGLLAGLISALSSGHHSQNLGLGLEADFGTEVLDVAGEISGRIVPIVILWLTIRLLLVAPVRKIWWVLLKNKIIKRQKPKEGVQYV